MVNEYIRYRMNADRTALRSNHPAAGRLLHVSNDLQGRADAPLPGPSSLGSSGVRCWDSVDPLGFVETSARSAWRVQIP
jgi:hypothetical protein